jgi:hypothetical protein
VEFRLSEIAKMEHCIAPHDPPELLIGPLNRVRVPLQSAVRVPLDDCSMYGDTLLVLYPRGQVEYFCSWLDGLPPDIERLAELQWFGTE